MASVEQIAGAVVTLIVLLDIFLTVLYARAGTALFSPYVARAIWLLFRLVSRPFDHRGKVLSFCGPVILIVLIFVWAAGLALGSGLIMHHVDKTIAEANPDDYDGLLLPGGFINPDLLRQSAEAREFVRSFDRAGKPIASLCHGPWVLASAGLLQGRTLTSWPAFGTI